MVLMLAANAQIPRLAALLHRDHMILVTFSPILIYFTFN